MVRWFIIVLFTVLSIAGCKTSQEESGTSLLTFTEINEFTLQTSIVDGHMVFLGKSDGIEDIVNPTLAVKNSQAVRLTVINGDGIPHDFSIPDLGIKSSSINLKGDAVELDFALSENQEGVYDYFCTVSGHRQAGMEGKLVVRRDAEIVSSASN